jgi:hypothetical protein
MPSDGDRDLSLEIGLVLFMAEAGLEQASLTDIPGGTALVASRLTT